ncbi:MAG: outer membrane protein assembly factor BamC [Gammaproteobacteria bacterium]|nr:outer membrane protein assembly factor BamC [Gammaproteobacteria bacterium]
MKKSFTKIILLALIVVFASGCSWSKKDKDPKQRALTDYRESRERSALEIPPDLSSDASDKSLSVPAYTQKTPTVDDGQKTSPATAVNSVSDLNRTTKSVSKSSPSESSGKGPKMYIERAGSQRWLVVHQPYSTTWSDVRDYILSSGLALERENKDAGIMETTWADNYATGVLRGSQKFLNKYLGSIYSASSRDKFRIRIEPGRITGTSEVYLTHRGMIEKVVSDNNVDPVSTVWEETPPDPSIEAEMLSLLMIKMGASEAAAKISMAKANKSPDRARIVKSEGGQPRLIVNNAIDIAWRRVGQTLDRVGFGVEDRDKSKWKYFVDYADPDLHDKKPGFFSKMFKKNKETVDENIYQILLTEDGEQTKVDVLAKDGTVAPDKVVIQIVKLLYEQLR